MTSHLFAIHCYKNDQNRGTFFEIWHGGPMYSAPSSITNCTFFEVSHILDFIPVKKLGSFEFKISKTRNIENVK